MGYYIHRKTGEVREMGWPRTKNWSQISSKRASQIETDKAMQKAKAQYAPGGGFGKGVEAGLERGRVKAVSSGMQNLVSAGLAGTTMAGGLGLRYEEEVAAPTRAGLEEERARAISGIEMQEAGMKHQTGMQSTQMQFQAGQSAQQNELQRYIAELQASLERESMAFGGPTTAAPTGTAAKQFPSLYGQTGDTTPSTPDWMGGGGGTDWEAKRLADETQAQKLQAAGRLRYDPVELESTWRGW